MVIKMSTIVISIGGSILLQGQKNMEHPEDISDKDIEDIAYIKKLTSLLTGLISEHKMYLVVGGGKLARTYISRGRSLDGDEAALDDIGIHATRLNARLLIAALGKNAYPIPAGTLDEAVIAGPSFPLVVMGGTHAAHTTDAVAALLAERVGADRLIIATSVDGVYTADPNRYEDAKKIDRLSPEKLVELTISSAATAGPNVVIDPIAARVIERSKIPTLILHGRDLDSFNSAIGDRSFVGTIVE